MMEAWLGSPVKKHERSLSPLLKKRSEPDKIVLGVLGTRSTISTEDLEVNILGPIIEAWGIPDEMILPSEGESSHAFQTWASSHGIPVHLVCCDWIQQGRKAGILREARIQRDATHIVLLQGPRSNALMVTATRLARKGRNVVISERPGLAVTVPMNEKNETLSKNGR